MLMALGILEPFKDVLKNGTEEDYWHLAIEAMRLSFADLKRHVADPGCMDHGVETLLDPVSLVSSILI